MIMETIRLSQQSKDQLIKIKRHTGIEHWNVLCRWAFCLSLSEPSVPPPAKIPSDSNVEMTWKVFGGQYQEIFTVLLKERCLEDGLETDPDTLAHQFRLHLHRGISYLAGQRNLKSIRNLIELPLNS
jgi:DNA sulfur modification protein DndE